ncbi:MAG: hypothetical protein ACRDSR_03585 [Pseudonocardiaceae bacterium]
MTTEGNTTDQPAHSAERASGVPPAQRDATTRYLCAAAHLDPVFGDAAIAEFLVEPYRAIPPAPGVDAAAVLRDAVAARARRRIRDGVLLLLLVFLAFVSLPALVVWLIIALASSSVAKTSIRRGRDAVSTLVAVGVIVLGIVVLPQLVGPELTAFLPDIWGVLPAVVLGLLALTVIGIDELAVHHLVHTSFRPHRFRPDGGHTDGWEHILRTLGHPAFQGPLARVAATGEPGHRNLDQADVVVHRGFSPFIGAGEQLHREIITLPLEPAEEDGRHGTGTRSQPRWISVMELQRHVATAIGELRSPSSLGPGHRLEGITQHEQVLMAADRLVTNLDTQPQPAVLPALDHAPAAHIPAADAHDLADTPPEWARYYQCFRIEAWDRDLATSCYLHIGTDQRMLFLEWTFCVLLPIRKSYREIDRFQHPVWIPLSRSLAELATLPATAIRRLRSVFHQFTPLPQQDGEVVPAKYGADKSLRELAAASDVQNYFQGVDVERYVKIVDAVVFRAVGRYLEDRGYSVVEFMKLADRTVNNLTISGGTFLGSAVGFGNTAQGNQNKSEPPKGRP